MGLINPCLKWPGGKRQLLSKLKARLPETYSTYYEPFIGGGALLFSEQPRSAIINDINKQLINIFIQVRDNVELLIDKVHELDSKQVTQEYYLDNRKAYNKKIEDEVLDIECAALMLWINKHCFNGLYRVNKKVLFNSSYDKEDGFYTSIDAQNLRNMSAYFNKNNVTILCGDFEEVIKTNYPQARDFIYFDSPYVPAGKTADFTRYAKEGFTMEDQKRLANLFRELSEDGVYVMLSNSNLPLVQELYSGFNIEFTQALRRINRNGSNRCSSSEVIITNY